MIDLRQALRDLQAEILDMQERGATDELPAFTLKLAQLLGEMKAQQIESNPPPGWEELQARANARPQ